MSAVLFNLRYKNVRRPKDNVKNWMKSIKNALKNLTILRFLKKSDWRKYLTLVSMVSKNLRDQFHFKGKEIKSEICESLAKCSRVARVNARILTTVSSSM